ncbi:collagen-binding protein [Bacteroidia bacterium]|nr:collagen-binding protein [Bacteroidia bacterium]GHT81384.1 collagen-binding protein [Bacteroidia bacterium]
MFAFPVSLIAQTISISGYIYDDETREPLMGVTLYNTENQQSTATDTKGHYQLSLPKGKHTLNISYLGYKSLTEKVNAQKDVSKNYYLENTTQEIEAVTVSSTKRANIEKTEMSVEKLDMVTIKRIPALMGEVDVIKALYLLPGVMPAAEGTSAFNVRGGSPDQNLILLDGATVYNASHLMGFFSVFNNDVLKDVKLYKGDIPAQYGGRLSSLLEVTTKDELAKKFEANGGIGLISSRLTINTPIVDDKLSLVAAGRRTYADMFLVLAPMFLNKEDGEALKNTILHFYDLNGKLIYKPTSRDNITLSGYYGVDAFGMSMAGMDFGNNTYTLEWKHIYSDHFFSNVAFGGSGYNYKLRMSMDDMAAEWSSAIKDVALRGDFTYLYGNNNNELRFGTSAAYHHVTPAEAWMQMGEMGGRIRLPLSLAMDYALYIQHQHKIGERLTLKYGLRGTLFQNIGNNEINYIIRDYAIADSARYRNGSIFNSYYGLEPRAGAVFMLNDQSSLKASYSRTLQTMHMISSSTASSPLDLWLPANPNIKPQVAQQGALGYFRNFFDDAVEASAEGFYKHLDNVVDYKDHPNILLNDKLEAELRSGIGYSYGLELMVRKAKGDFTGWVSYTYSRSYRKIDQVNNNRWFQSPSDRPHSINVVASYDLTRRIAVSANWTFASGMPVTFPEGRFEFMGRQVPLYGNRNTYRMPAYHRLDAAVNFTLNKNPRQRYKHEINVSAYNVYARHNPWYYNFVEEPRGSGIMQADMIYLFSIVPSVSYNFWF